MEKCELHYFRDIEELQGLRSKLLAWYDKEKRELPWRTLAEVEKETNVRAYAVWVSEVMLQQTQVATVIEYYNKWMEKWPTVEALASATLEEVCVAWTGLGYYSRGRRLWEGARKVMSELGGVIPSSAEDLVRQLPGVGRYTAGAIASIAFNKTACIVDGNVARVMSRQRVVGGRSSCQAVTKHLWELSSVCVDPERPGDFNQALMEIGAMVCLPRNPRCHLCPLSSSCHALQKVKDNEKQLKDARKELVKRTFLAGSPRTSGGSSISTSSDGHQQREIPCPLCLAKWEHRLGVMNYPHKTKKKPPVSEEYGVAVLEDSEGRLCLRQRPTTGLLAGLWCFPSLLRAAGTSQDQLWKQLHTELELLVQAGERAGLEGKYLGKVTHQFTHVHHLYQCWHITLLAPSPSSSSSDSGTKWVSRCDLASVAVSASVKKVLALLDPDDRKACKKRSKPSKLKAERSSKKQRSLHSFSTRGGKSHTDRDC